MVSQTEKNLNFKTFINVLTDLMNGIKSKNVRKCLSWK